VPVVITCRVNCRKWDENLQVQSWELERNRATHRITAVSEAVAALCVHVEGVSHEKISVIHNGVEIPSLHSTGITLRDELNIPEHVSVIGYAGNYRAEKGHEDLLYAFGRVLEARPYTHLLCCGLNAQGLKSRFEDLASQIGVASSISLLDSRADIGILYRALDVYVHPSRSEGFSNSILEAMAHTLPVVATAVGGTPEAVLDGVTGFLVPPKDPPRLADAIIAMLEDPNQRRTFGQAARDRVQRHFSVARMVDAYARLYGSLLNVGWGAPETI